MNNHNENERAELHKTIWHIANELRGSVDGWDFKNYVLGMLLPLKILPSAAIKNGSIT